MSNTFTVSKQQQSLQASVPLLWLSASYFALEAGGHLLGNLQLLNDGLSGFLGMLNVLALLWFGHKFCQMPAARWFGRHQEEWLATYSDACLHTVYQQAASQTCQLLLVGLLLAWIQQQWLPAVPAIDAQLWLLVLLTAATGCFAARLQQALPADSAAHVSRLPG